MRDGPKPTHVEPGEFPFPLLDGPKESRYLVWIRNHSNYMAARGFLDYLRALGVLVRGEGLNALIFLPYLVVVAVAVTLYSVDGWRPAFAGLVASLGAAYLAFVLSGAGRRATRRREEIFSFDAARRLFRAGVAGLSSPVKLVGRAVRLVFALYSRVTVYAVRFVLVVGTGVTVFTTFPNARFPLTWTVLILWAAWSVLFALGTPFFKIRRFERTMKTGSDSSVKSRDAYERTFGGFLLAFMAVAAFEVLAQSVEPFHDAIRTIGWPTVSTLVAVAVGALSASDRLLALLPKAARVVALPLIGLLGALIPLAVVLAFSDFLVFRPPLGDADDLFIIVSLFTVLVGLGILLAIVLGVRAFSRWDFAWGGGLLVALVMAGFLGLVVIESVRWNDTFDASLDEVSALVLNMDETELSADLDRLPPSSRLSRLQEEITSGSFDEAWANNASLDPGEQVPPELEVELAAAAAGGLEDLLRVSEEAEARLIPEWWDCAFDVLPEEWWLGLADLGCRLRAARREVAIRASFSETLPIFDLPAAAEARRSAIPVKVTFLVTLAALLWLVSWLTVDVNLTSIHGLYRDRLASAFLVGVDREGDVDIEEDVNLAEICRHEAGSVAPYHLVNVALNLQGSADMTVRDRKSDFFVFSKRFVGGDRTRYCRSESMEQVFPQIDLATAMAISAGAASPNMGRATHPALRAIMTLLNIRLGFWVPNPQRLEKYLYEKKAAGTKEEGFTFPEVFREELREVWLRWQNLPSGTSRRLAPGAPRFTRTERLEQGGTAEPTVEHGLVGIAYSGGGIRSATLNLGITQALHKRGVFAHVDYMSTVSGGGYLGSSISALMRQKVKIASETRGTATVDQDSKVVRVTGADGEVREYRYHLDAIPAVSDGQEVVEGQRLVVVDASPEGRKTSAGRLFGWRVRPGALLREALGSLDETSRWVNVSDGGHIENLATIELLRRRCKYIIVGDGEADPEHHFNGLATLIRTARIDLGIDIDISADGLRLGADGFCRAHWAVGTVRYPAQSGENGKEDRRSPEEGYLLYLKSSVTGHEDEVIREYRHKSKGEFPHESTADQSFTEGQFEAYRSLGQHVGESVLARAPAGPIPYDALEAWMQDLVAAQEELLQEPPQPQA